MKPNKTVDGYVEAAPSGRRPGLEALRRILATTELEETVKWGAPCYTIEGKNAVGLGAYQAYVEEAIALQKQGRVIKPERRKPVDVPLELKRALGADRKLRDCFEALTPGKKREYADHVSEAKRAETRARRLQKILPMILAGKGLHDRYRKC